METYKIIIEGHEIIFKVIRHDCGFDHPEEEDYNIISINPPLPKNCEWTNDIKQTIWESGFNGEWQEVQL